MVDSVEAAGASASLEQAPAANETIATASSDTSGEADLYPRSDARRKSPALGHLGRFELKELLGQGAFGRVYKAYDPQLDRFVALKIPTFGPEDNHLIQRFAAEAKAAARLRHPNIVPVFDTGDDKCQLFIASAFIEGQTLASRLKQGRPDFRESAEVVMALASALDCAHSQRIVHRDVKPANIMIDAKGSPLLMDFGLARMRESDHRITYDGSILGTPAYMSPEQAAGKLDQVGPASDQYSLGALLYELLCGKRPFDGPSALVISQVISQQPVSPTAVNSTVPHGLEAICLKAMSKSACERYETCQDMADDLSRWVVGESIQAQKLTAGKLAQATESIPRKLLSRLTIVAAVAVLLITLLSTVVIFSFQPSAIPSKSDPEPSKQSTFENGLDSARLPAGSGKPLSLGPARAGVENAIRSYESGMQQLRKEVAEALLNKEHELRKNGDLKQADECAAERSQFEAIGRFPAAIPMKETLRQMLQLRAALNTTYESAIRVFKGNKEDSSALALEIELAASKAVFDETFGKSKRQLFLDDSAAYLPGTKWLFGQFGRKEAYAVLTLKPDRSIGSSTHPNESRWRLQGKDLVFTNTEGRVTTTFNSVQVNDGLLELSGRFYNGSGVVHYIREVFE